MPADTARTAPGDAPPPCPVCNRPAKPPASPFCSARCRSVDLGRWLGGSYAVPGTPDADLDDGEMDGRG